MKKGGEILKANFKGDYGIERKAKHDLATDIDLKAEEKMMEVLGESNYSILGEETGKHEGGEKKTWIIDPLDGTTNFILNTPTFSSAAALIEENRILISATYIPMTDDLIVAENGEGAYLNDEKIRVSDEDHITDSFLIFCHGKRPEDSMSSVKIYQKFKTICKDLRQLGSASIEFATVSSGRAEAFLNPGIPSYDAASGVLVLREAGGKVTNFKGEEWSLSDKNLLGSNGKIHDEILRHLNEIKI